ncbi:MAG: hypothetical protein ABMB14_40390 [Myxococcota bacterium]
MAEADPQWFPVLEPPPGGLRRLRDRLDGRRAPWWAGFAPVVPALIAATLAVGWWLEAQPRAAPIPVDAALPTLAGPGPLGAQAPPVSLADGSVLIRVGGIRVE